MNRVWIILLLLPVLAMGESPLELSQPGEPLLTMDAVNLALGGSGEARWNTQSGLPSNPALLAGLNGVTFSTVIQFRQSRRDTVGGTWTENRQDFPAFQFTLALPAGWRLGLGYRSMLRSRGSYTLDRVLDDYVDDSSDWEGDYELNLRQEGGVSTFPISVAWQSNDRLRVGLALSMLRANLFQEWSYSFPDSSEVFDRKVKREADWHGTAIDVGLQARLGKGVDLSLLYRSGANLSGLSAVQIAGQTHVEESSLRGSYPASWSTGLSWSPGPSNTLSVGWEHLSWSEYDSPIESESLYDVDRFSMGYEWKWIRPRKGLRPERRIPFRVGFRYGRFPGEEPVLGGIVREMIYSFGTGFRVQEGKGSVDLAVFMQNLDAGGTASETRWGLALSLRTSEKWKRRSLPY